MKNKFNIILDTDIGNSWDDQFALTYLLCNQNLFNIEAITIELFQHSKLESKIKNQQISYDEILNVSYLLNMDVKDKIYMGNDTVDKIIEIAKKNEKTYILAIGTLTNICLALRKEKSIIDKIEIIWLGGNSIEYGNNNEFNFMQDTDSVRYVINSNINMTIIPARNVAIDLVISLDELKSRFDMNTKIAKYLCYRFLNDDFYGKKDTRVIWDISVIAFLKNQNWFDVVDKPNLYLDDNNKYLESKEIKSKVKMVKSLNRDEIYNDFFDSIIKVM